MSVHICVVSACVLSDWWRARLEVKVEGHYLQPEELLLLPPFLPAHFLPLTWPRGQLRESLRRCSVKCVTAAGAHVHAHPWPWARNSLEDMLTCGTSHSHTHTRHTQTCERSKFLWNVVELFSPESCALHPLHFISKADLRLFTLLHLSDEFLGGLVAVLTSLKPHLPSSLVVCLSTDAASVWSCCLNLVYSLLFLSCSFQHP